MSLINANTKISKEIKVTKAEKPIVRPGDLPEREIEKQNQEPAPVPDPSPAYPVVTGYIPKDIEKQKQEPIFMPASDPSPAEPAVKGIITEETNITRAEKRIVQTDTPDVPDNEMQNVKVMSSNMQTYSLSVPDYRNIFTRSRQVILPKDHIVTSVVRPEDHAVLRIETQNLKIVGGTMSFRPPYAVDRTESFTNAAILASFQQQQLGDTLESLADAVKEASLKQQLTGDAFEYLSRAVSEASSKQQSAFDALKSLAVDAASLSSTAFSHLLSNKPRLRKIDKKKPAYLILHFPPQSFAEETFFEAKPSNFENKDKEGKTIPKTDGSDVSDKLQSPVRARIANESRLVFTVPKGKDCDIEYSLAGVLSACKELSLKISVDDSSPAADNSGTSGSSSLQLGAIPITINIYAPVLPEKWERHPIDQKGYIRNVAAQAQNVVKMMSLAAKGDIATINALNQRSGNARFYSVKEDSSGEQFLSLNPSEENATSKYDKYYKLDLAALGGLAVQASPESSVKPGLSIRPGAIFNPFDVQPELGPRDATTTSIEMPWRLILSPHSGGRWRHAADPVFSRETTHTELWHSRLVMPHDGNEIEPPYPDEKRTVRAVWALSGDKNGDEKATDTGTSDGDFIDMKESWPSTLPAHDTEIPFRTTLDNSDRYQIAHLSSNFKKDGYKPEPIDTNMMMLTALGGWLDSRGSWDPPGNFSVEEWVHRATMGRDHYARVVYRGFLFPFGHRVSLVKVSERKFHNKKSKNVQNGDYVDGNPAYLRQRLFIVVREKERTFDSKILDPITGNVIPLKAKDDCYLHNKFPFTRVRLLTETTPDLDNPSVSPSVIKVDGSEGQSMFWPHVDKNPFLFQFAATDLEGRRVLFELPMIFVENTLAAPYKKENGVMVPNYDYDGYSDGEKIYGAVHYANIAKTAFATKTHNGKPYNRADLKWQRVALAPGKKSGDTSFQVKDMTFGGFAEESNVSLQTYSEGLTRPIWFPQVETINARIGPIAHLSGATESSHELTFNDIYLKKGFDSTKDTGNPGEVFVDVTPGIGPNLDFSSQGDKSGGFLQPNLKPSALSRLAGPVMVADDDLKSFIGGTMPEGAGFPTSASDLPLPLLFGCIPLGKLIDKVTDVAGCPERIPKFISEAGSKAESFINDLTRLFELVSDIPAQPVNIARGALEAFKETLKDLKAQSNICTAKQKTAVNDAVDNAIKALCDGNPSVYKKLAVNPTTPQSLDWHALLGGISTAGDAVNSLATAARNPYDDDSIIPPYSNVYLPAGFKQSILNTVQKIKALLKQLEQLETLTAAGNNLWNALNAIVGDPAKLANLFSDSDQSSSLRGTLNAAIISFNKELKNADLLDGAPRKALLAALDAIPKDMSAILSLLTGDELTIRFDWNPEIKSWPKDTKPLFRVNDKKGLVVAVEAKVKKNGSSGPKISVNCSLKHFDLVLVATVQDFLELNFEKIEFSVDSNAKMDVDVKLSDIKFVGVLSFVEALRDLIPLDGFSDPPYLDITSKGIEAGFDISLPTITSGMLNLANVSLGARFTVPFIGQPMSVCFNFCRRERPFTLTVLVFGGGGFFGITVDPRGVQVLEAAFEFGAALFVDLFVASGSVEVMAGIYFRMEGIADGDKKASLTGYFRLGGSVSVLGLITASIELYLALTYDFDSGKCIGEASLNVKVSVLLFSASVTIHCRREFAGSNGDPTLRQMLGPVRLVHDETEMTLENELDLIGTDTQYAWREYIEAFA